MAKEPGLGSSREIPDRTARPNWPIAHSALNELMEKSDPAIDVESPCQACGACCAYSSNWPRFTTEDDAALDLIPEQFVNERLSGMRCDGERCSALSGKVGVATSCGIYADRPGSLPDLHARRSRMHHGAAPLRAAGTGRGVERWQRLAYRQRSITRWRLARNLRRQVRLRPARTCSAAWSRA